MSAKLIDNDSRTLIRMGTEGGKHRRATENTGQRKETPRLVPNIVTNQPAISLESGAEGRNRTGTSLTGQGILSPLRVLVNHSY